MKRVLLLGNPVSHSLSPVMQNTWFATLGLDWRYDLLDTPGDQLAAAVARLRTDEFEGANVTIPHKVAVMQWLDGVGVDARQVGAVNTIWKRAGQLVGENTDLYGFAQSLREAGVEARGMRTVILGAGGSARAVAFALAQLQVAQITILNRTAERGASLAETLAGFYSQPAIHVNEPGALDTADLIVNTTSVGMVPNSAGTPLPDGFEFPRSVVVFDLVYRPLETRLLREARAAGAQTISGLEMLLHQGAAAFKIWTGREAQVQAARTALAGLL